MFSQVFVSPLGGAGISGPTSFPGVGGYFEGGVDTVGKRTVRILLECFLVCNANRYRRTQVEGQFPQIQLVEPF